MFALLEMQSFEYENSSLQCMDIQIFSPQAASEMDLLFVNIPDWLTMLISHAHTGSVFVR